MRFKHIPLYKIIIKENVRFEVDDEIGELIESIERYGIIQPVLVVPRGDKYELVSGHRRFAAMKARHEPTIPAYIKVEFSERDIPLMKLTENIQRKQMSPSELVKVFDAMKAADPTITSAAILADRIGKSDAWVYMKYHADQEYHKLVASGVEPEVAEELSEGDLLKLRHVKNRKEKVEVARKKVAGKGKITDAESYTVSARKRFKFRVVARRTVEVLCGSDKSMGELLDFLAREGAE